jgi:curved DNA-binding protein CbpA
VPEWENYYKILGVGPEASDVEIKRAYHNKSSPIRPDRMKRASVSAKRKAEEELKRLNRAYDTLKDPAARGKYHEDWLRRQGQPSASSASKAPTPQEPAVTPSLAQPKQDEHRSSELISYVVAGIVLIVVVGLLVGLGLTGKWIAFFTIALLAILMLVFLSDMLGEPKSS